MSLGQNYAPSGYNWQPRPPQQPPQQPMGQQFPQMVPNQQLYYGQQPPQMGQFRPPGSVAGGIPTYQQPGFGYGAPRQPMQQQHFPAVPGQQQQQPARSVDPEGMPSVVEVCSGDKTKWETQSNVLFTTSVPAVVPPLVTTISENDSQLIQDGGSARPYFLRPSIYQVPTSEDILKQVDIPFGMIIKPFDELEVEGKIVSFFISVCNFEVFLMKIFIFFTVCRRE